MKDVYLHIETQRVIDSLVSLEINGGDINIRATLTVINSLVEKIESLESMASLIETETKNKAKSIGDFDSLASC